MQDSWTWNYIDTWYPTVPGWPTKSQSRDVLASTRIAVWARFFPQHILPGVTRGLRLSERELADLQNECSRTLAEEKGKYCYFFRGRRQESLRPSLDIRIGSLGVTISREVLIGPCFRTPDLNSQTNNSTALWEMQAVLAQILRIRTTVVQMMLS